MGEKIDWKRKLTSRKFWVAICGLVSGVVLAFHGDQATADTICGCIMSVASVIAYIIGEGLADAADASSPNNGTYVTNNGTDAIEIWNATADDPAPEEEE